MNKLKLSGNALLVLKARYLRRDALGRIVESPDALFERVARTIGEAGRLCDGEDHTDSYHELLGSLDFLPNSPTLMNAGAERSQLSACFVLPVDDSLEDIFESIKRMALIQRTGGGTGFSFSRLRPRGDVLSSSGGKSSGPVSFLRIIDAVTANIKQGGRRRGANMGILRVDHPDIMEFIRLKSDQHSAQNFNLSVGITDDFMHSLENGSELHLINPTTLQCARTLPAREVFDAITQGAWKTGDPGLVFLDAINRANPTPQLGDIKATNPCGEVPLLPNEACNLGSINLTNMICTQEQRETVNWEKLRRTVHLAVRFLDDVIEAGTFPFEEISRMVKGNRKIGLGVMGFADMLIELGISYDSDEAVNFAEELMRFIASEALIASEMLATKRGLFPNWKGSQCEAQGLRVRNATRTAIAPTGTIGIIAGASAGIEPLFAIAYCRSHVLDEQTMWEFNPHFLQHIRRRGLDEGSLIEAVRKCGNLREVSGLPAEIRSLFMTALEIPPERHLQIQAAFQRHVDNSVSKTINLPPEATVDDIGTIFRRAWKLGLKGITVFRYGCKPEQVFELGAGEEAQHREHTSRCDPGECRL
jgi:ribonucleoside-diphosphate reductase alpha chain